MNKRRNPKIRKRVGENQTRKPIRVKGGRRKIKFIIMPAFRVTAPRDMGEVKKGFEFVVNSNSSNPSQAIKEYLTRMGFNQHTISYWSSGNWKCEKL